MPFESPLVDIHRDYGADFTVFAGWNMPLKFTSALKETLAVRNAAGVFDVSHMGRLSITGKDATRFLNTVTTNQVDVEIGRSRYTLTLNYEGGIKDDDMAFRVGAEEYMVVVNAASREKILAWFEEMAARRQMDVEIKDETFSTAMLAVQGPQARQVVHEILGREIKIKKFRNTLVDVEGSQALVSRTGYTGEDGYEIIFWDVGVAERFLRSLVDKGVAPCGLGARDILRLEAGLPLYGQDMDEETTPVEADLMFAVDLSKDFIGKDAVASRVEEGPREVRVGLKSSSRRAPRHGDLLLAEGETVGRVTSGTFSPTVGVGVAMGYLKSDLASPGTKLTAKGLGEIPVEVVKMPFYDTTKYGWRRKR
ncbi:MAG TPA: glycine cleavage system aminomethyltransferase GcvT [Candidatus Korarchaeota archaeon]|nr:glycine cleavage system aminomethyltransferase GcvT [Candidatus Korarchaeota archaeon]